MATHSSSLAWRILHAEVHRVAKSQTRLSNFHFYFVAFLTFDMMFDAGVAYYPIF